MFSKNTHFELTNNFEEDRKNVKNLEKKLQRQKRFEGLL